VTRARTRGKVDPNGVPRHQPSSSQGIISLHQLEGGLDQSHCSQAPKRAITAPADGVDKLYRQLMEIHAIATAQLAKYAR
jgi:hypothetical protein